MYIKVCACAQNLLLKKLHITIHKKQIIDDKKFKLTIIHKHKLFLMKNLMWIKLLVMKNFN
jgi:hypothetical protein